jgi:hypothetical protein
MAGLIAPWYVDEHGAGDFLLSKFQMREGNGAIQVSEQGLYYIYAQVRAYEADGRCYISKCLVICLCISIY